MKKEKIKIKIFVFNNSPGRKCFVDICFYILLFKHLFFTQKNNSKESKRSSADTINFMLRKSNKQNVIKTFTWQKSYNFSFFLFLSRKINFIFILLTSGKINANI